MKNFNKNENIFLQLLFGTQNIISILMKKKKSFGIADNCNLINLTLERRKYKMIFNEKNEHLQ